MVRLSSPLFFLILLLLPAFNFNGDRGDRWRELLTLLPLFSTSPLPWCLYLNYISALASTATLFTHSSIHIHLACTCLVPTRVTWRKCTHETDARTPLCTNTDRLTHICSSAPLRRRGSRRAMEMSEGRREEMKILGRVREGESKGNLNESRSLQMRRDLDMPLFTVQLLCPLWGIPRLCRERHIWHIWQGAHVL